LFGYGEQVYTRVSGRVISWLGLLQNDIIAASIFPRVLLLTLVDNFAKSKDASILRAAACTVYNRNTGNFGSGGVMMYEGRLGFITIEHVYKKLIKDNPTNLFIPGLQSYMGKIGANFEYGKTIVLTPPSSDAIYFLPLDKRLEKYILMISKKRVITPLVHPTDFAFHMIVGAPRPDTGTVTIGEVSGYENGDIDNLSVIINPKDNICTGRSGAPFLIFDSSMQITNEITGVSSGIHKSLLHQDIANNNDSPCSQVAFVRRLK
jgi:hypothetical protein